MSKINTTSPIFICISPEQPAATYNAYYDTLDEVISKTPTSSLLLAGDFNTSYDSTEVDQSSTNITKKVLLKDMLELHSSAQINHISNFRHVTLDLD